MDDVQAFRNNMAESGYEYTPKQASKCIRLAEKLRHDIYKNAREDPSKFEKLTSLTLQEKQQICRQFAEQGKEVTLDEMDDIINLVLGIYEEEKLY